MATNVNGNWKDKFKKKAKQGGDKTKVASQRGAKKIARNYGRYGAPTVGLFKSAGKLAMKPVKLALRFPGAGLAATGAYYLGKAIVNKGEKVASRSMSKQFKRKPFGKTQWTL